MAWTEVCKVNFENACRGLINFHKFSANKAIRQLREESGIPLSTLWRWWSEIEMQRALKSSLNNENEEEVTENINENNDSKEKSSTYAFTCRGCGSGDATVFKDGKTGKPYGHKSKFHDLCTACAGRLQKVNRSQNEEGMQTVCPHCGGGHSIPWTTVKSRLNAHQKNREEQNG